MVGVTHVRPLGESRQAVLDYLIHEADLDGLVTVSSHEVGEAIGVEQTVAARHIRNLAADGLLTIIPNGSGYKRLNAIQLAESVLA